MDSIPENYLIADNFSMRLKGYMFTDIHKCEAGILFKNCKRIHTLFMRFDLKVIYLDEYYCQIDSEIIKPGRIGKKVKGVSHILEIPIRKE